MDLEKLKRDWKEDPQLNYLAFDNVEDLSKHLLKVHRAMMKGELGVFGYLYRQQTLKLKELQEKINNFDK